MKITEELAEYIVNKIEFENYGMYKVYFDMNHIKREFLVLEVDYNRNRINILETNGELTGFIDNELNVCNLYSFITDDVERLCYYLQSQMWSERLDKELNNNKTIKKGVKI